MANLDAGQVSKLNNMCAAAVAAQVGTAISALQTKADGLAAQMKSGKYTVTAADVTATKSTIATGLTAVTGFILQVYRANILLGSWKASASGANVVLESNSTSYVLTADDVVMWIAF